MLPVNKNSRVRLYQRKRFSFVATRKHAMRIPTIRGIIDRRILANFHIDHKVMANILPAPFRPKIVNGYAIGGVCLIRLTGIRPKFFPLPWGINSENAAHRIAVEWDIDGETQEGVYIPRRDTNSRLNRLAGGTIFPGVHHHARFTVSENANQYSVKYKVMMASYRYTFQENKANVYLPRLCLPLCPKPLSFLGVARWDILMQENLANTMAWKCSAITGMPMH